jgi:hypothetical protein
VADIYEKIDRLVLTSSAPIVPRNSNFSLEAQIQIDKKIADFDSQSQITVQLQRIEAYPKGVSEPSEVVFDRNSKAIAKESIAEKYITFETQQVPAKNGKITIQ